MFTESRKPIRDGDKWKREIEEWNLETGTNPEDQGCCGLPPEQQNVKAVSVWHCTATTAPCNCCPNCYAHNVRSSAAWKQLKQKKSNSQAQHHLSALDLFWASFFVRVQLTSLVLISPRLWSCIITAFSLSLIYWGASTSPRHCQDFSLSEFRHKSGCCGKSGWCGQRWLLTG